MAAASAAIASLWAQPLDDHATETDLTRSRAAAVRAAIDELRPHDDDDEIAGIIERLVSVAGPESEGGATELAKVERSMLDMLALERSARIGPERKHRARAARGSLGAVYLSKSVSAYGEPAARARIEQVHKAELGS